MEKIPFEEIPQEPQSPGDIEDIEGETTTDKIMRRYAAIDAKKAELDAEVSEDRKNTINDEIKILERYQYVDVIFNPSSDQSDEKNK